MSLKQRITLMKVFIEMRFGCCPLVWMFYGRILNRKINYLHERSLRIVDKDNTSSFDELLQKGHSFTIHHRNIQSLDMELYKVKENLSNEIMNRILSPRTLKYNLRTKINCFSN